MAKFLTQVSGRIREAIGLAQSAGASDADRLVATGADGRLDNSLLPTGIGAETVAVPATEAIAAGAPVNIYAASGTVSVRNADATAEGKEANGFVLAAVSSGATATVYLTGLDSGQSGLTAGARYYLAATAGTIATTAPSSSGNIVQYIGTAVSATELAFAPEAPVTLA